MQTPEFQYCKLGFYCPLRCADCGGNRRARGVEACSVRSGLPALDDWIRRLRLFMPAPAAQKRTGLALRHSRGDRGNFPFIAAKDGVHGVSVHYDTWYDRRRDRDADLRDRLPPLWTGEAGLSVWYHVRVPSDRQVSEFMAGRRFYHANRELSNDMADRHRPVRNSRRRLLFDPTQRGSRQCCLVVIWTINTL